MRAAQKFGVFGAQCEFVRLDSGGNRHFRLDFGDNRLDSRRAQRFGDGDAMIAVQHEIDFADLIDFDGRQPLFAGVHGLDFRPARFVAVVARQKAPREIFIPTDAADDGVKRDVAQLAERRAGNLQLFTDIFIRQQFVGLPFQKGDDML